MAEVRGGKAETANDRIPLLYNPRARALAFQALLVVAVALALYELAGNAIENLRDQRIATGFGFLDDNSGFGVVSTPGTWLMGYTEASTYGAAFLVGLINTLVVAVIGIVFATIAGFLVGIARLSPNWLLSTLATAYIEVVRNIPLLLQLFFWYFAVLRTLPPPRGSLSLGFGAVINVRGLFAPAPVPQEGLGLTFWALVFGIAAAFAVRGWARRRQVATGRQFPVVWAGLGLVVLPPLFTFGVTGAPVEFAYPELRGLNYSGGMVIVPEFVALVIALSLYTAAFIAENVRSGIMAVNRGQTEAAQAIGLRGGQILRLVVIPQAMRVIIPPLTGQYLNLTKNSSFAVAIAYPDLVSVFAGTTLNQTGQALEVLAITMAVYLTISIITALGMNFYNARVALVER